MYIPKLMLICRGIWASNLQLLNVTKNKLTYDDGYSLYLGKIVPAMNDQKQNRC
jgi:hypothetical protein